jgi:hypothetical protein
MSASRTVRALSLSLLAAVVAACGDMPSAPLAQTDGPLLAKGGNGGNKNDGVVYTTISIDPTVTQVYKLGPDAFVYIPANAVCTLDTPYGMTEWDKDCQRATQPIGVDVIVVTENGIPSANFYPDLRFAPAAEGDYANWVFLGFKVKGQTLKEWEKFAILYRPTGSVEAIDESLTDPTLRAFRYDGMVVRRLKHFSGYNVSLGYYQEQSGDPYSSLLSGAQ